MGDTPLVHDPDAETVRAYLRHQQGRGDAARLAGELEAVTDPLARLHLREAHLRAADPVELRRQFVERVRVWAARAGVSAEALAAEGAARSALRRAGIRGRTPPAPPPRARVPRWEVLAALTVRGEASVEDLAAVTGASTATVRAALADAEARGAVKVRRDHTAYRYSPADP